MTTIGVLVLAAATATSGIGKPHAGKHWLKPHVVQSGPAPAGGPTAFGGMAPGMGGPGSPGMPGQEGRRFPNVRSQVYFVDPPGMHIGWQTASGGPEKVYLPAQLTVPARYNFMQGYIYRLKLTDIPGRAGLQLYPTIEVAPSTPATDAYLTHNPVPAQFTEEDFDQVTAGNFVTKVIYLPDPKFQELAIAGVETLVSTRLEPGVDPVLEADRRGTILMIVRMGAIDLEMPQSGPGGNVVIESGVGLPPTINSTPGVIGAPVYNSMPADATVLPPGTLPPGTVPNATAPAPTESVPVDEAPVSPAPFGVPPTPEPSTPAEPEDAPQPEVPNFEAPLPPPSFDR